MQNTKQKNFFTSCRRGLESRSETQLQLPRPICDVVLRHRRSVIRRTNRGDVVAVVHVVEEIEQFDDAIERRVVRQLEVTKDTRVDAVNWFADEVVSRLD